MFKRDSSFYMRKVDYGGTILNDYYNRVINIDINAYIDNYFIDDIQLILAILNRDLNTFIKMSENRDGFSQSVWDVAVILREPYKYFKNKNQEIIIDQIIDYMLKNINPILY